MCLSLELKLPVHNLWCQAEFIPWKNPIGVSAPGHLKVILPLLTSPLKTLPLQHPI